MLENFTQTKTISGKSVFIIAEIGKNFIQTEEDRPVVEYLDNAKKLVKAAKEAGADAVKFQTHNIEDEQLNIKVISSHFKGSDRYQWVKRNHNITPIEFWRELKQYADELGIIFFSTPMSRGATIKLAELDLPLWKVGSGDILDFVMLDHLAETGKPIIISAGMTNLEETDKAISFLQKRTNNIILMHCVSLYPCPIEKLNLGTIKFFQQRYQLPIGFSSHSVEWQSSVVAVDLGAVVIEKHFSFDRNLWGSDHKVSLLPDEFKQMVKSIKQGDKFDTKNYGEVNKVLYKDELEFRPLFRKSLMAGQDLRAGTVITKEMIYAMRPQVYSGGLPSEEYENILGKKLKQDLNKYDPVTWDIIERNVIYKRKICFVITSSIHYSRSKILLEELSHRDDVELQIIIGASAILEKYGNIEKLLEEDGFKYNAKITMTLEGGTPVAMAKTTGIGITEFATSFDNLKPDIVLIRGDRYEILSAAIAAAYLNIFVAHIEGGDVSGTIDESVRHAITKFAHVHFSTNELSKQRILRMGENLKYVFNFGAPELEFVAKNNFSITNEIINHWGVGDVVNIDKPYIMVMQHPVTTEVDKNRLNINETLHAVYNLRIPTIWFWPNIDAGTDEISKGIRIFREHNDLPHVRFIKYLSPKEFIGLLQRTGCLVGNSSAGIKECSYLGIPVVNIGTRQNKRMRADNVVDVNYNKSEIIRAINQQLNHGKYQRSTVYYQEGTSKKIVDTLATIDLYTQKSFQD